MELKMSSNIISSISKVKELQPSKEAAHQAREIRQQDIKMEKQVKEIIPFDSLANAASYEKDINEEIVRSSDYTMNVKIRQNYASKKYRVRSNNSARVANITTKHSKLNVANVMSAESGESKPRIREEEISQKFIIQTTNSINTMLKNSGTEVRYSVHEGTGKIMISVMDSVTNEVIREIPEEGALDAFVRMLEINGIHLNREG